MLDPWRVDRFAPFKSQFLDDDFGVPRVRLQLQPLLAPFNDTIQYRYLHIFSGVCAWSQYSSKLDLIDGPELLAKPINIRRISQQNEVIAVHDHIDVPILVPEDA